MDLPHMREMVRSGPVVLAAAGCLLALNSGTACGQWEQIHKLSSEDGFEGDFFGASVAVSEETMVVAARFHYCDGECEGSAYVFDTSTGQLRHRLNAAGPWFGWSVAISDDIIVVGAIKDDHAGPDSGSAYVFDAVSGEQLHKLTANDAAAGDYFGYSVAIDGNTVVVAAVKDPGAVYIFDAGTGEQQHKLLTEEPIPDGNFGVSVAVDGNLVIASAPWECVDGSGHRHGAVYVFDATTGEQLRRLTADEPTEGELGVSISIDDGLIAAGAMFDDEGGDKAGAVYLFDAVTGDQLKKLLAEDAGASEMFGVCVSISGASVVIGTHYFWGGGDWAGSAYVFDVLSGEQVQKFTAADTVGGDYFGEAVAICEDTIIVGAKNADGEVPGAGAAYMFYRFDASCPADISGPDGVPNGFVDVHDLLAVLAAWGPCEPDCPEDIDGDGVVDVLDLLVVLAAWGPCE